MSTTTKIRFDRVEAVHIKTGENDRKFHVAIISGVRYPIDRHEYAICVEAIEEANRNLAWKVEE